MNEESPRRRRLVFVVAALIATATAVGVAVGVVLGVQSGHKEEENKQIVANNDNQEGIRMGSWTTTPTTIKTTLAPSSSPSRPPTTTNPTSASPTDSASPTISAAPTVSSRTDTFIRQALLPLLIPISGEEPFSNTQSPQYQAAVFLANELMPDATTEEGDPSTASSTARSNTVSTTTRTTATSTTSATLPPMTPLERSKLIQRYTLAIMFYALDGRGWTQRDHWLSNRDECDWRSIKCSQGIIYAFEFVDIPGRGLVGSLPREIGELTQLIVFSALGNELTGELPTEALSKLTRLHGLKLSHGKLKGGFVSGEGYLGLPQLTALELSHNELTGSVPESIALLTRLSSLRLDSNLLTGTIPTTIGQLTYLTELLLQNNTLVGTVPSELGQAPSLRELRLEDNVLSGSLPDGVYNESSPFFRVEFSRNQLSGTLSSLVGNLQKLKILALDHNGMTGTIPSELALLTNSLTLMYLEDNLFSGSIPTEVCSRRSWATQGFLRYLNADCLSADPLNEPPPHQCSCCNWCCIRGTFNCTKQ